MSGRTKEAEECYIAVMRLASFSGKQIEDPSVSRDSVINNQ
jgi:hypothetical protein